MAEVVFGVDFGEEWERAQNALTFGTKTINERMAITMRKTTNEAIIKVRLEILRVPTHGKKHRGTRALIARGVTSKRTRRGRRIVTEMPPGMAMLPRGFESQWRHPVFGRGMVTQAPHSNWFIEPIGHFYPFIRHGIENDLQNMAQDIKRMTEG